MAHGYSIFGKAGRLEDFIPSLIGIKRTQENASDNDLYFVRYEIEEMNTKEIAEVALSHYVCFDSLPANQRDPILTVKGQGISFYIPAGELIEIAKEHGDKELCKTIQELRNTSWS